MSDKVKELLSQACEPGSDEFRSASDCLAGFELSDIVEAQIDELTALGLDGSIAGALHSLAIIEIKPLREWSSAVCLAFLRSRSFLKSAAAEKWIESAADNGIDGEMLADEKVVAEDFVELLGCPMMIARRLLKDVRARVDEGKKTTVESVVAVGLAVCEEDEKRDVEGVASEGEGEVATGPTLVVDDRKGIIPVEIVDADYRIGKEWKTILIIGETGTGKSTTINSMVNFLMGVEYDNPFRYKLIIDERKVHDGQSVTDDVTEYHLQPTHPDIKFGLTIIDTPGFGDTRGLDVDKRIMKQIEKCFRERVCELHAVCFTIKASATRLTRFQEYVYGKVLGLFGKDIAGNIMMLITFCDGKKPPAIKTIKAAALPYKKIIKLNNSAFFQGFEKLVDVDARKGKASGDDAESTDDEKDEESLSRMFWDLGMKAFSKMFRELYRMPSTSLSLTKEVLREKEQLELLVTHINQQISLGLSMLEAIRTTISDITQHSRELDANKDFVIKVSKPKITREDISGKGIFTTTCRNCNYTCHNSCAYSDDKEKRSCCAISGDNCTVCPKKCHWTEHSNIPYIYHHTTEVVAEEVLDKKEAAEAARKGISNTEAALLKKRAEYLATQVQVQENIAKVQYCLTRLSTIALRDCTLTEDDYFEQMIEIEFHKKEPGFKKRIESIRDVQDFSRQLRDIKDGTMGGKLATMSSEVRKIDDAIWRARAGTLHRQSTLTKSASSAGEDEGIMAKFTKLWK
jgi:GTP-binding protein EngB required for normal cell division